MAVTFTKEALEIFRDYVTDMVPESGVHKPPKADVRVWGTEIEDILTDIGEIGEIAGTGIVVKTSTGAYVVRALVPGVGIVISDPDGVSAAPAIAVDQATAANVRAATEDKVFTTELLDTASAEVTITDGGSPAINWTAGINFVWTLGANRAFPNPTNGIPGTYRTFRLLGNSGTDRTITGFGNQFSARNLPTLTDIDNTQQYLLTLRCITSSWFSVQSTVRIDPP